MNNAKKLIIFTDMDGTLLDHHTYSHAAADSLLASLNQQSIPVIPTTSKTFAELIPLRASINNQHAFIVENGAAIYLPKAQFTHPEPDWLEVGDFWLKYFVSERAHWRQLLATLPESMQSQYTSFTELGVAGIAQLTGLTPQQAKLSADRQFGEPVHWQGSGEALNDFCQAVADAGGKTLVGGRFVHISGDVDKGKAVVWLIDAYQRQFNAKLVSLGLGDSGNDVAMLARVDYPIIVRSPVHEPPLVERSEPNAHPLLVTQAAGPEGWVEGVTQVIKLIEGDL